MKRMKTLVIAIVSIGSMFSVVSCGSGSGSGNNDQIHIDPVVPDTPSKRYGK